MRRPLVTVRNHRSGELARFRCIVSARAAFVALTKAEPAARCTLESADGRILRERDPYRETRGGFRCAIAVASGGGGVWFVERQAGKGSAR